MTRILWPLLCGMLVSWQVDARDLADRRGEFRNALRDAERGTRLDASTRRALQDHPLYPYLEYAELARELDRAMPRDVETFLSRHGDLPIATRLRGLWLQQLGKRGEWASFRKYWQGQGDATLQCHAAVAELQNGRSDAWLERAEALWLTGDSAPAACDAAFAALAAAGRITPALRWQRIELAAAKGNVGLMRFLGRALPAPEAGQAAAYANFIEKPSDIAANWPRTPRSARFAELGLTRLAASNPDRAEGLLAALASPLGMAAAQVGAVQYQIALWSAASYLPEAWRRLQAVPVAQRDARLREWMVRVALSQRDFPAVEAVIAEMDVAQQAEPRMRYIKARMRELQGDRAAADALFGPLASEAHYHGFLAADRLGQGYAICPQPPSTDAALRETVAKHPGLQRAIELHALDKLAWAIAEWDTALAGLPAAARPLAVARALEGGWADRAVFGLNRPEDARYYELRFPLQHKAHLTREARRNGLDAAWVAALTRAESAWQPSARSHADARGLMQLLPGTAAPLARRLGIAWRGPETLYDARANLSMGAAHLAEMLARFGQQPFLATAAYNAGPAPVTRWQKQRPINEVDLWIETIPWRETRDYVTRVMAFSVVYDWRLGRQGYPLSERLRGQPDAGIARRAYVCPTPAAQVAATP